MDPATAWTLLVLAGGSGIRLGGADKAALPLRGLSLLDTLLAAVPAAVPVVVAGPPRATVREVAFRPESPPGGGPVAGIACAVGSVTTPHVVVVAVDMPWAASLFVQLERQLQDGGADVVVPVSADGHRQLLLTAWHTAALRSALDRLGEPRDRAVRDLVALARSTDWPLTGEQTVDVADIDTPDDLERARRRAAEPRP